MKTTEGAPRLSCVYELVTADRGHNHPFLPPGPAPRPTASKQANMHTGSARWSRKLYRQKADGIRKRERGGRRDYYPRPRRRRTKRLGTDERRTASLDHVKAYRRGVGAGGWGHRSFLWVRAGGELGRKGPGGGFVHTLQCHAGLRWR